MKLLLAANERLLDGLNSGTSHFAVLGPPIRFAAHPLLYILAACFAALLLLEFRVDPRRTFRIALAAAGGLALTLALLSLAGSVVYEVRPFVGDPDTRQLLAHAADNSFPSEHASAAALIAVVGALAWPRWRLAFLGCALAIGVARVAAGLHYPADVATGWLLGGCAALAAWQLAEVVVRARTVPDSSRPQRRDLH